MPLTRKIKIDFEGWPNLCAKDDSSISPNHYIFLATDFENRLKHIDDIDDESYKLQLSIELEHITVP
jgi:hypothetical protein